MFVCMCCTFFFCFGEKEILGMVAPSQCLMDRGRAAKDQGWVP